MNTERINFKLLINFLLVYLNTLSGSWKLHENSVVISLDHAKKEIRIIKKIAYFCNMRVILTKIRTHTTVTENFTLNKIIYMI